MNNASLWVLGGVLLAGMLMRMPIGFSMIASGIAYLVVKRQDLGLVAEQVSNGLYNSYVLLAVPMFVLAANVMNAGTVSERLFDFCRILVGRLRGGLAQVDILVSLIFSGMSPDGLLPEIVERPDHPWFIGVQFHPELKSKPFDPHPLFAGFVAAALAQARLV